MADEIGPDDLKDLSPLRVVFLVDTAEHTWFSGVHVTEFRGAHGVGLVCSDPKTGNGYVDGERDPKVARFIRHNRLVRAFNEAAADGKLCCRDAMRERGYGSGCSADANVVMQYACYRGVIFE